MNCPKCSALLAEEATSCEHCGPIAGVPGTSSAKRPGRDLVRRSPVVVPDGQASFHRVLFGGLAVVLLLLGVWVLLPWNYAGRTRLSAPETAAIATLRNLASCQAQMQTSEAIDCDGDGIGEYGTLIELTGLVPVRKTADGSVRVEKRGLQFLPASLSAIDANGIATRYGYCFRVYLPDAATPAGFIHETGTGKPGLSGIVGVNAAEKHWCAYAWPLVQGPGGTRAYFINEKGDVLRSPNVVAKWSGKGRVPSPESAFLGTGITSETAFGTVGRDGDSWAPVH